MRELPEPEVADEIAEAQGFLTLWKSVTVKPMTTREVDFAKLVRKQAYEDGLRDAEDKGYARGLDDAMAARQKANENWSSYYYNFIESELSKFEWYAGLSNSLKTELQDACVETFGLSMYGPEIAKAVTNIRKLYIIYLDRKAINAKK